MQITPNKKNGVPLIPDEAIKISEQLRRQKPITRKAQPKPDKYSEEKVSPTQPSHDEAKNNCPDTNVKGG